jgi:hypothetical protein
MLVEFKRVHDPKTKEDHGDAVMVNPEFVESVSERPTSSGLITGQYSTLRMASGNTVVVEGHWEDVDMALRGNKSAETPKPAHKQVTLSDGTTTVTFPAKPQDDFR